MCWIYRPPSRVVIHCLQHSSGQQLIIVRGVYLGTYTLEIHFWDVFYLSYSDHWAREYPEVCVGCCWPPGIVAHCSVPYSHRVLQRRCSSAIAWVTWESWRLLLPYSSFFSFLFFLSFFLFFPVNFASLYSSFCSLRRGELLIMGGNLPWKRGVLNLLPFS